MFDIGYFIRRFDAIPERSWTVYTQYDDNTGQRCAIGWLDNREDRRGNTISGDSTSEFRALSKMFIHAGICYPNMIGIHGIAAVNNGVHPDYKQDTPKKRIMAALYKIKEFQAEEVDHV